MSFSDANHSTEIYLGRVRHRLSTLALPFALLFLAAGIVSYFANKRFEVWQLNIAYSVALAIAVLGWLIPVLRHLAFYIDLTTTRLVIRRGLFGGQTVELAWNEISGVEQRRATIVLTSLKLNGPLELTKVAGAKALATQLRTAAAAGRA
jgi:hypothetical protein